MKRPYMPGGFVSFDEYVTIVEGQDGNFACYDYDGNRHKHDGPAVVKDGQQVWWWHGDPYNPTWFDESWSPPRKAWWMRAKMEGEG